MMGIHKSKPATTMNRVQEIGNHAASDYENVPHALSIEEISDVV
jgi:hypothetical protein